MKKLLTSIIIALFTVAVIMAFTVPEVKNVIVKSQAPQDKTDLGFPKDVTAVIESTCFNCHSDKSSNIKSKAKLNFDHWNDYSDAKKVGKLGDIKDVINKGKMPPKKFLERFPDKAFTDAQKQDFIKWTEDESKKLIGE